MIEGEKEHIKAGKICGRMQAYAKKFIKPGLKLVDIVNKIENKMKEEGGDPAWPTNLSLNEVAAHDHPGVGDERVLGQDLLKVDIGVHIDGYIADSAQTLDFTGEHGKLVEASQQALENVKSIIKPGIDLYDIGKTIDDTITKYGFKTVRNLGGHSIERHLVHAGLSIPNVPDHKGIKLPSNIVVASEPFASTGNGLITEAATTEIFMQVGLRPTRNPGGRKILQLIAPRQGLPFGERWISSNLTNMERTTGLRELLRNGTLKAYPPLKDRPGSFVSQAETTFLIYDDEVKIIVEW